MVSPFSAELSKRITTAVQRAEAVTDAEIRVALVQRADSLPWALAGLSTLLFGSLLLALEWHSGWKTLTAISAIELVAAAGAIGGAIALIVSRVGRPRRLRKAAERLFVKLGMAETKERTGVLLFVALEEHGVELIADVGIVQKVPNTAWHEIVLALGARLHSHEWENGLVSTIDSMGDVLSKAVPRTGAARNELPDLPVIGH